MIEVLFLDVGGPLYGDRPYYEAVLRAVREVEPEADAGAFWALYEECRRDQQGSFTRRLAARFVGRDEVEGVVGRTQELWSYPPEALQPDAARALPRLAERFRLGILGNQRRWIRETLARDGLDGFLDLWIVSEELGVEKPDPRIFRAALEAAAVPPDRVAMCGDRLENDVVPAREAGMRAVWILRGEAPDDPTPEQAALADATVRSLLDLPAALEGL